MAAIFTKGNNFCNCLFASLSNESIKRPTLKVNSLLLEWGEGEGGEGEANYFLYDLTPIEKGDKEDKMKLPQLPPLKVFIFLKPWAYPSYSK